MNQRIVAYVWGMGLVVLSAWPAWRDPPVDSYPLSTYPMFSVKRGQPLIHRMVAVDRQRNQQALSPELVANTETLQAAAAIGRAVAAGPEAMRALCLEVAARVARSPDFESARSVELRAVRYDPIEYFTAGKRPLESRRLWRCRVPR